ncbi:unnamed protein product, partial [Prorocentrum cordatum]
ESLPPGSLNFDPEYQAAYDMALEALHSEHGVPAAPLRALAHGGGGTVEVMAVCLYKDDRLPRLAANNHALYCKHRGYTYQQFLEVPAGGWDRLEGLPREPHYWKIQQTLEALEREDGPEWVLVIDCDAFFTNASIGVSDLVASYGTDDTLFFVAEDPAGINTGVLLFRRHEWTRDFLRRVLQTPFVQIWDQSQFFWQILQEFGAFSLGDVPSATSGRVALVHQSHLNAYHSGTAESWNAYAWQSGDYAIHYAGCPWDEQFCWDKMVASARLIEDQ